ncbi:MAG: pre-peptidase C-terminal domain-containing protein [Algicola sp.]|nr:pre-peptidase C-terminal domain-containing protein [Algicola sp.]
MKKKGQGDTEWGVRAVIDGSATWGYSWAYMDTFKARTDREIFIDIGDNSWVWIADSISHEVGHSMGLSHDGDPSEEYYQGHGTLGDDTYWAPIMGWTNTEVSPYGLSQWDKGEYTQADNSEDDLSIITSKNGFGYRADDHGSTMATATEIDLSTTYVVEGNIEKNTDLDYFEFAVGNGQLHLKIEPDNLSANLDILAILYDNAGVEVARSNPSNTITAELNETLSAGTYYLAVDGIGFDDPASDGYSDYGSLGYFQVIALSATPPVADTNAPTPNPMTWLSVPTATSADSITMSSSVATDAEGAGVEYRFTGTAAGQPDVDSGWQSGNTYVATGLAAQTQYSFVAVARDTSSNFNETAPTAAATATTEAQSSGASGTVIYNTIDLETWTEFSIEIPAGATNLVYSITGGTSGEDEVDLYGRYGKWPTPSKYDCRPYEYSNEETCTDANPPEGTLYISIYGYQAASNITLSWSYE